MKRCAFRALLASVLVFGSAARSPGQAPRRDANGDLLPEGAVLRFGSARWRHGASIGNSALSPDGKRLATAASESVSVWDLETGKRLHDFRCEHGAQFCCPGLTFSPDGSRLGYVRGSEFACAWDIKTGKELMRRDGERALPTALCRFTADGKEMVLSAGDSTEFWDLETGQKKRSIPVGFVHLLSPDAKTYVRMEESNVIILGDTQTGKEVERWEVPAAYNGVENGVAFAPDGRALAVVHRDREIQVRDIPGGKVRVRLPLPEAAKRKSNRTSAGLRVGFSADGQTLLLSTEDGWIRRWDLTTQTELPALQRHLGLYANSEAPSFHSLPDGRTLVSTGADGLIRRWDLRTGRELSKPEGYMGRTYAAYAPDGRFAAVGDGRGRVDLWDAKGGKLLRTFREEGPAVTRVAFAPDGKTVAVAQAPAAVQLYDALSGQAGRVLPYEGKHEQPHVYSLKFSPDGRSLCVKPLFSALHLWDVRTGEVRWRGPHGLPAFSSDGTSLAVAYGPVLTLLDAATGKERSQARLNSGRSENLLPHVDAVAFSPDGRRLAVALWNGQIVFLDAGTGAELGRVPAVDNSRRDALLMGIMERQGHRVAALAFSGDGKWLVSGGTEPFLRLWEVATASEVMRLDGHRGSATEGVWEVAFSPDGRFLFSCGADAQAYLWSTRPPAAPGKGPEALWDNLGADAATAYQAVWALSEVPTAPALLRERLVPVKAPEKPRLARLLADLDHDSFPVREAASKALAELGDLAIPFLEEALKARPSQEARQRLQKLLDGATRGPSLPELRRLRAVQALELAGTAEARATLRAWAGGEAGARLTEDAKAALARLEKRD